MKIKLVKCESGGYIAYYEERDDIIANGENKKECIANLKKQFASVKEYEANEGMKFKING